MAAPLHPYTQALLSAEPEPMPERICAPKSASFSRAKSRARSRRRAAAVFIRAARGGGAVRRACRNGASFRRAASRPVISPRRPRSRLNAKIVALIGARLWHLLPVIVLATFVVFSLLQLVPGDPAVDAGRRLPDAAAHRRDPPALRPRSAFWCSTGRGSSHAAQGDLGRRCCPASPSATNPRSAAQHAAHRVYALVIPRRWAFRSAWRRRRASARASSLRHRVRLARRRAAELLARDDLVANSALGACTGFRRPAPSR